jgi:hypothetical protein
MNRSCLTLIAFLLVAVPTAAQVTERAVPFDTVGRVPAITQPLAERLHLGPPLWPVLGSFTTAQLYSKSTGGFTLVVTRPDGAFDRYDLTTPAVADLRGVVETALATGRRAGIGEQTSVASDPAGNAFVRNQALLGLFVYGPAAATLVGGVANNGSTGLGAELIVASGTFAAALVRRNAMPAITTAQNRLSTHAALRGAALGETFVYVAHGSDHGSAAASVHGAAILGGSVAGTLIGLQVARTMTDAEAASSAYAADFLAAGSLGLMGVAGAYETPGPRRPAAAVASAAMLTGYFVGPSYARRAPYTVTAGDVRAMTTATAIGLAAAATPFIDQKHFTARALSASLTAGMVGGALAGDRWLVRPRDHTTSEATLLWVGAGVGAFVGGGVAAIGNARAQPAWGLAVAGALIGTIATEAAVHPKPGGRRILSDRAAVQSASLDASDDEIAREAKSRRAQITFDPIGAAFAAMSRVGTFSVLRVSF